MMRFYKKMIRKTACLILFAILTFIPLLAGQSSAVATRGIKVSALDKSSGEKKEIRLYNKSYAVIIGIDQYKNLKFDQQLSYAVRDAKGVEEVLRKNFKFDKIITLYNKEATKANIMKVLSGELSKLSKEDSVFVFWAGHGYTEKTDFGNLGYLLPFDGNFEEADLYKNISMTMIKDDISKRIPAKHIFFVMDACYSGLLVAKRGASRKSARDFAYLREITKEQVRQVLTAGGKDQQVLDGGPKGHSVFTGRFIELLENTDDFITATEISASVKEKVFSDARARSHTQTPKYGELFGLGDYVFVPSLERKVEDTKAKITDLQKEVERLNALEKTAAQAKDERAKRRAELDKRAVQAKLKAEQLRQQSMEENRRKQEQEERARKAREKELAKAKKDKEKRLAFLVDKVAKKRKGMGSVTLSSLSPEATIAEMRDVEARIKKIRADFARELADSKKSIFARIEKTLTKLRQERQDEFETEQEFKARVAKKKNAAFKEEADEVRSLTRKIEGEYKKQIAPFIKTLKKLSRNEFTLGGGDLVLEVNRYNPSSNSFPVSIKARQGVKGIAIASNAAISIPRHEAKEFKQHFQNNILRPELAGHFDSLDNFREIKASIIDDATGKRYNLFSPRSKTAYDVERKYASLRSGRRDGKYVADNNGIVYDTSTGLEWVAGPDNDTDWYGAKSWVENLSLDGHGWRMPTIAELRSLYQEGAGQRNMTPLLKTTGWWVWSGKTEGSSDAWAFYFYPGPDDWAGRGDAYYGRAFAVRSRLR